MIEVDFNVVEPDEVTFDITVDERKTQTKDCTPKKEAQTVTPDAGYLLEEVDVAAIPSEYIIPVGTKEIAQNGDTDVTEFATAHVAVPQPSGKITLNQNGTDIDIADYALADVAVPPPSLQQKTVTPTESEQTVEADSGYDGLSRVTVNRIPPQYIVPSGTKQITANGTGIDVADYAAVDVNVPGIIPSGKITLTQNATGVNIAQYAEADIDVPDRGVLAYNIDNDGYTRNVIFKIPKIFAYSCNAALTRVENLQLTNIVTEIMQDAFNGASRLENIVIPSSVEYLPNYFVRNCGNLHRVECRGDIRMASYAFGSAANIREYIFGGEVEFEYGGVNCWYYTTLFDFSHVTQVVPLLSPSDLKNVNTLTVRMPSALYDEWTTDTNWAAAQRVVFERV